MKKAFIFCFILSCLLVLTACQKEEPKPIEFFSKTFVFEEMNEETSTYKSDLGEKLIIEDDTVHNIGNLYVTYNNLVFRMEIKSEDYFIIHFPDGTTLTRSGNMYYGSNTTYEVTDFNSIHDYFWFDDEIKDTKDQLYDSLLFQFSFSIACFLLPIGLFCTIYPNGLDQLIKIFFRGKTINKHVSRLFGIFLLVLGIGLIVVSILFVKDIFSLNS